MKKKLYIILVKAVFAVPLFLFGLWLMQLLYFPEGKAVTREILPQPAEEDIFSKILREEKPVPRGHFHMIDEEIRHAEPFQPVCLTCHGTYPHSKEKKVRSILNFHNGFFACAVCHVRKEPGDEAFSFIWVDRETGITSRAVAGEYGRYPAKIFPVQVTERGVEHIIHPVSEKSAQEFLKHKDKYTADQIAQAKSKLHERLTKKPVFCTECHKEGGYFDFAKLGYPKNRVDHLTSSEVATMIEKYETFYLPEVIDFSGN